MARELTRFDFDFVSAVCNRPCNGGKCIKPNMCLCDEGSVRSACLPDDLRDSYNKDDEQQALSPTPDRFEKQPSAASIGGSGVKNGGTGSATGGNNGYGGNSGNTGTVVTTGGTGGGKIGSGGGGVGVGEDSGNNGRGNVGNGQENVGSNGRGTVGNGRESNGNGHGSGIVGNANGGSVPSGGGDANGGSSRVSTTTVNSLPTSPRNTCKYPCLNGGSCQGSVCVCRQGYNGENCAERECKVSRF